MTKGINYALTKRQYLMAFGYGLWLASTAAVLWGGYIPLFSNAVGDSFILTLDFLIRSLSFSLMLFASGLAAYRFSERIKRVLLVVPSVAFTIGGITIVVLTFMESVSFFMILVVGFSFGVGSGVLFCAYQRVIAAQKVFSAGLIVLFAAVISAAVFFLINLFPSNVSPWITTFVLTPLSILVLAHAMKTESFTHPMYKVVPIQHRDRNKAAVAELWRPLICIAFSAFLVGLVRVQGILNWDFAVQVNLLNMVGLLISSLLLIAFWRMLYSKITLRRLYQVMFPLTATVFLLLPFFSGASRTFFVSIVFLVFSVASSLMVITCIRTARNQFIHPICVYGLFAGCVYTASIAGSGAGLLLGLEEGLNSIQLLTIALVALYILSFVLIAQRKTKIEEVSPTEKTILPEKESDHSVESSCTVLIRQYQLSKREEDVLVLLAKGRDTPYIAEELYISKNTVRSHTKNIFQKIGVHSKQELLTLVERVE